MKKIMVALAVLLVIVAVALALAVKNSSRIVKEKLEAALGSNVSIASLSLSWGGVEASGIRVEKDGELFAKADRIVISADVLGFFKHGLALSSFELEKPFIKVHILKDGSIANPLADAGGDDKKPGGDRTTEFSIARVTVKGGELQVQDDRRPPKARDLSVRGVEAEVRNIAYPLAESPSPVVFGGAFDGAILSGQLNAKGELNMKTKAMQLRLDGQKVVLLNLDEKGKGPFARAETMSMNIAAPAGAASYTISDLSLVKPYLRVEADRQGEYINPFDEIEPVTSESKGSKPGSDPRSASPSASDASAVLVQKLTVTDGTLHYYNGKVATPAHLTRIEGVSFTIDAFAYPFSDKPSNYIFAGHVPGRTSGAVSSSGWTILKNKDTDAKVTVRGLDITQVKPYYHKKGDTDIEQGAMNLDMDLKVKSRMLNAPGRMVLRDLVFASGKGTADKIIGVPKAMVVDLLKSKNGEISLDFTLEGSLDDPKFSMRESLMKRLTAGLAGQLGLPISEIGEAVVGLGKQGVEQTTRSVRGIGEGLQKLFKR